LYNIIQTFQKIAAVAVVGAMAVTGTAQLASAQAPEKKVKDQGEYDLFNQTLKDANNPQQQIKDLDSWTQKYPESDKTRTALYKKGLALAEQNQKQPALVALDKVVKDFPNTSEAINAKAKATELRGPARR